MAGMPKPLANPVNVALVKHTLVQQLSQFKKNVRCITAKTLDACSANLFKPEGKHVCQFKGLAIDGIHAAMSFNVNITPDTQHQLAMHLIELSRKCTALVLRNFLSTTKSLTQVRFDFKGKASWDDKLPTCDSFMHMCEEVSPHELCAFDKSGSGSAFNTMHTMICPKCGQLNIAQNTRLQQNNLDIKIKCTNCCIRSPSGDWKCNCDVVWHICQRHAHKAANTSKAKGSRTIVTSKASKRPLHKATLEQLLDDDLKRESKFAKKQPYDGIINLGYYAPMGRALSLGMIPPRLRERFPDAVGGPQS